MTFRYDREIPTPINIIITKVANSNARKLIWFNVFTPHHFEIDGMVRVGTHVFI